MKWKTAISTTKDKKLYLRGESLLSLMEKNSFSEVIFLLLLSRLPSQKEKTLFDMLLVSSVEHGVEVPTAFVPRVSASVGNPMNAAMAAGLLAMGDSHGGAAEACANMLMSKDSAEEIVASARATGAKIPGFGHAIYKDSDPRAELLLTKAKKLGLAGTHVAKVRAIEKEIEKQFKKSLPLNVDGAIAALMLELGFDARLGKALFGLSRISGMIAHAHEEMQNEKPYRRFDEGDVEYTGKAIK
jgi:citryl-CoA lyase